MRWQSFQRWHLSQKSRILLFSSFDGLLWRPCYHLQEKKTNFKQCRLFCNLQPTNQIGAQLVSIWVRRFLSTDLLLLCFLLSKFLSKFFFEYFFQYFKINFSQLFFRFCHTTQVDVIQKFDFTSLLGKICLQSFPSDLGIPSDSSFWSS